jgi:DNA-binding CsgD family transcriptional regulator
MAVAPASLDVLADELEQAVESLFAIGHRLLAARLQRPAKREFGEWIDEQKFGFGRTRAWELMTLAEHEDEARPMLCAHNIGTSKLARQLSASNGGTLVADDDDDVVTATATISRQPTNQRIDDIRRYAAEGLTTVQIADTLGISTGRLGILAQEAGIAVGRNSRLAIAERVERTRDLAKQGATSQQIASEIGVGVEVVRVYSRKYGIEIPADATTVSGRTINSTRIVASTIDAIDGIGVMFDHIDYSTLPVTEIDSWIIVLDTSVRSLQTLRKHLKEMIQP